MTNERDGACAPGERLDQSARRRAGRRAGRRGGGRGGGRGGAWPANPRRGFCSG